MITSAAQYTYGVLMARRGLFALILLGLVAAVVGLGAAVELMQASADPYPGMPRLKCKTIYGPGGNVISGCWAT